VFLWNASEGLLHADRLARRIVELGGPPDFAPDSLALRSYCLYDDRQGVMAMVKANLFGELAVTESYRQVIALFADTDAASRSMLADVLSVRTERVEEFEQWLAGFVPAAMAHGR